MTAHVAATFFGRILAGSLALLLVLASSATLAWPNGPTSLRLDNRLYLSINMWNLRHAEGRAVMRYYGNGSISFEARLSDAEPKNASLWVLGYPEVYYGYNPWTGVWINGGRGLPARVADLDGFTLRVNYTIWRSGDTPLNFAYDVWVTRRRFSRGVGENDFELMIWLYSVGSRPAGINIMNVTLPLKLNGRRVNGLWEVWMADTPGRWLMCTLKAAENLVGYVEIDLGAYLRRVAGILRSLKLMDISSHYVEDVELGSEFGSPFVAKAEFGWRIYALSIGGGNPTPTQPATQRNVKTIQLDVRMVLIALLILAVTAIYMALLKRLRGGR